MKPFPCSSITRGMSKRPRRASRSSQIGAGCVPPAKATTTSSSPPSKVDASPWMTSKERPANCCRRKSTSRRSFSIAKICAPELSAGSVIAPRPGPISSTMLSGLSCAAVTICSTTAGLTRKC
jgi:hypothetical protein